MRWPSRNSLISCSRETCSAKAGVASSHKARLAGKARYPVVAAFVRVKSASLALDLQPVGADINLQSLRLFLGLVEILAEYADRDDQRPDDEKQKIAIDWHRGPPSGPPRRATNFQAALYGCGRDSESDVNGWSSRQIML